MCGLRAHMKIVGSDLSLSISTFTATISSRNREDRMLLVTEPGSHREK